ncbi:GNAT family N-acetyltransferase [Cryptosporangium sp. NPDC048952]|uniref:GNAT family N-acetyltransferase n=1 Tax=Cryptosporangium sp. NPDC048952 TaxID=3363961 RepID=UPI0037209EFF
MLTIEKSQWDSADSVRLRAAQRRELDGRYGNGDHEPGGEPDAASMTAFLIARDSDGRALGCGGLRVPAAGAPRAAEIKRMYVDPSARGTGVATALLRALETEACVLGVRTVVLETGTAQPDAIRFYEREGYHRIGNFGPYRGEVLSVCYARTVTD